MKYKDYIFLIIIILNIIILITLNYMKLPSIMLPKFAQHNTLGELPIVEVADDGDFYEKDGEEYNYFSKIREERSNRTVKECIEDANKQICIFSTKITECTGHFEKLICKQRNLTRKERNEQKLKIKNCKKIVEIQCNFSVIWEGGRFNCDEINTNFTCNLGFQ